MGRRIIELDPIVEEKAENCILLCKNKGVDLLIYCTGRTLEEQAILYRRSRTRAEIDVKIKKLRDRGFDIFADAIEKVGPCSGTHVTNAAPGESWHNYMEAWDAVPLIGGKPAWNPEEEPEAWAIYGESVRLVGMNWAGDWISFKELPHAQLRSGGNPLKILTPEEAKSYF